MTATRAAGYEVVPLQERVRYVRAVRIAIAVSTAFFGALLRHSGPVDFGFVSAGAALYLTVSLGTEAVWRFRTTGGSPLFGAMLILDSVFLAWAAYATGGSLSPVRYLILLHLVT